MYLMLALLVDNLHLLSHIYLREILFKDWKSLQNWLYIYIYIYRRYYRISEYNHIYTMQLESYPSENENLPEFVRYFTEAELTEMSHKDLVNKVSQLNLIHELKLIKIARRKYKSRLYSKKSRIKTLRINSQLTSERIYLKNIKESLEREINLLKSF